MEMTVHKEKDKLLNKITPFAIQTASDEQNFMNLGPQYTNDYNSLNGEVFDKIHGENGLFFPNRFIKQIKYNFYLLDKDINGKVPVVFVHGAGGTPADWNYLIKKINRAKFSPVLFYYPTGLRLNSSAEVLSKGIKEIYKNHGPVILIAHSMGGLVSRGAIRLLLLEELKNYVPLYISLSTPYGGHVESQDGIEHLPDSAIVPSWRDIATKSEYLKILHSPHIPVNTNFLLLFGYKDPKKFRMGPNSDGSITIKSQLDPRAQSESSRLYGFDDDHVTILKDPEVTLLLNEILEKTHSQIKQD